MKKPINLNRLRAFVAIAEAQSFAGAAARLGVSQPTLSLQLAQLEDDYGVRLVHRPARRVRLTRTGEELLELALPLAAVEEQALSLLEGASQLERGQLRISADAPQHVLGAMARFAAAHPQVALALSTGNSEQVVDRLLRHEADIAVVADVAKSGALSRERLHTDRVVLVVAAGHALARRRFLRPEALADHTLIEREEGSRTRAIVRRALTATAVTPRARIELGSREAVLEAAALGLGIGCVFQSELGDRRVRPLVLRGADMSATEYTVYRKSRRREAAISAFAATLREVHAR